MINKFQFAFQYELPVWARFVPLQYHSRKQWWLVWSTSVPLISYWPGYYSISHVPGCIFTLRLNNSLMMMNQGSKMMHKVTTNWESAQMTDWAGTNSYQPSGSCHITCQIITSYLMLNTNIHQFDYISEHFRLKEQ